MPRFDPTSSHHSNSEEGNRLCLVYAVIVSATVILSSLGAIVGALVGMTPGATAIPSHRESGALSTRDD